ncbi:MAG TPA: hypothetical protein IAA54_05675 [Candidatus Gallacutalibacter pullicola]|uniref:Uncharacterized protein n=1 Tax=Candidatus Gallacutalibacter pullicola TaxID=2840830 RepID=A0A9D1DQF8_9FIRM|nr:hypothetical protein [Candidatus Gallacutalibacter pullicola]
MSGGSMGYIYNTLIEYKGYLCDPEMDSLLEDFCKVLHDAEWMHSADISEETYLKTVEEFKAKWFLEPREKRLKEFVEQIFQNAKNECLKMIGE